MEPLNHLWTKHVYAPEGKNVIYQVQISIALQLHIIRSHAVSNWFFVHILLYCVHSVSYVLLYEGRCNSNNTRWLEWNQFRVDPFSEERPYNLPD